MIVRDDGLSTTERLYDAALELFRTRGFEATAIDDIAAMAGTSRRTFFNHFPTKQHLLARYHGRITHAAMQFAQANAPRAGLVQAMDGLCRLASLATEEPELGRALLRHIFADEVLMEQDRADTERFMGWLVHQVNAAAENGEIRAGLDREQVASMLLGTTSAAMIQWVNGRRQSALPRPFLLARFQLLIEGIGGSP